MVKVIGLTGGIATGKSNVSDCLSKMGYQIIDADKITYQLQHKDNDCLNAITKHFGNDILEKNGELNRSRLAKLVFANKENLTNLVRIMDPYIRSNVQSIINNTHEKLVVFDAPTLFENGYAFMCDRIIVVTCTPINQLNRLQVRNNLSISDSIKRIKSQWPLNFKEKLADYLIDSNGSIMQTRNQVIKLFNKIDN
ncbi:dephospho-CoA kinase [Apilactobacillus micheneri]|uniref:Dephospho-CoA kinase n=1 Tax=Apilactobacillus micheneri TaxID=1899430 RepID=A0A9Q8MTD1_9LACO|nr:dephospho-CoA kinase [Apilactobacillus micheneri]TPR38837.1 dephospho-CoA kinase [Apilactobacillus micheneri]TPR41984.1 dephospho-CoA kinase [Apilactobacillus micheneri]TPR42921.1 dephospho-CoA kinase [Apilactobacillus micheneri]TPR43063.1 dephospho-CoA kinase [Apilactobacillus micheneri]TPR43846.1 dephospho-CoA kinase [Apilactobacillus micheneri]